MYVDTDMLRMGADFSDSAATIARRGADALGSTTFGTTIFGDFDSAHGFHGALATAHQTYVTTMDGHGVELNTLAGKATSAASAFETTDESAATDVASAGSAVPDPA